MKAAKKRRSRGKSLERIAADFRKSAAPFSVEQALELAQTTDHHDSLRRLFLMLLTKSGKELIEIAEGSKSGAQAIAAAHASAGEYAQKLHMLADEIITVVSMRLMMAVCCRDDAIELIHEAEKGDRWAFLGAAETVKGLRLVIDNTRTQP